MKILPAARPNQRDQILESKVAKKFPNIATTVLL